MPGNIVYEGALRLLLVDRSIRGMPDLAHALTKAGIINRSKGEEIITDNALRGSRTQHSEFCFTFGSGTWTLPHERPLGPTGHSSDPPVSATSRILEGCLLHTRKQADRLRIKFDN
jgi:hypothetical protein